MSKTAWERVKIARLMERPTAKYYIDNIFDKFLELHGDRSYGDDNAILGGIGLINGHAVTVIAEEKGVDLSERTRRNFGSPHPEGYRKALRLMKQAEKFNRPIITIIDTQGAYAGTGAEERGQGEAIAENLKQMATLSVPIICVVIGEGGSGGALAIAVGNKIAMLENAGYSILSPEGFATILWRDASRSEEAAEMMKMTAEDLLDLKIIDKIIDEPEEGAQEDPLAVAMRIKRYFLDAIDEYSSFTKDEIRNERLERFRRY